MKTSVLFILSLLALSATASAQLAGFNDDRSIGLIQANSQIYFSQSLVLRENSEGRAIASRNGSCKFAYNRSPMARQLNIDTPATILATNQNFLYASADGIELTISCVVGTSIGQLERELFAVGAQLVLTK